MQLPALNFPVLIDKLGSKTAKPKQQQKSGLTLPQIKWRANCPSIRDKISRGFALAIGVSMLGMMSGHLVERYDQGNAIANLSSSYQKANHLAQFKTTLAHVSLHQYQLAYADLTPKQFEQRYRNLVGEVLQLNSLLVKNQSYLQALDKEAVRGKDQTTHQLLSQFLTQDRQEIAQYSRQLRALAQHIAANPMTIEQVKAAQKEFKNFSVTPIAQEFDRASERVFILADNLSKQEKKSLITLKKAEQLSGIILGMSLLISAGMATIVAAIISKAIAHPLELTTALAQRVTETSNFKLSAPIITNDEVGKLTLTLNKLIHRVGTYTDELKQAEAQLIQNEKMSSLGTMVAGIAHEVNNPISFVHGNLQYVNKHTLELLELVKLYQKQYPKPARQIEAHLEEIDWEFLANDLPKILNSMQGGTERIRQLVLSLRNFSRLDEADRKDLDLHSGIDSTLVILNNRINGKIEVIKNYGHLPTVECYPSPLNQVFMNILSNAIDALLGDSVKFGGKIEIQTKWLRQTDQVQVIIRDNGPGIAPEIQKRIFDPFFTTKPVGKGTGLGLAVAHQIVEKHQGTMQVISQLGEGTQFTIALPISQSPSRVKPVGKKANKVV